MDEIDGRDLASRNRSHRDQPVSSSCDLVWRTITAFGGCPLCGRGAPRQLQSPKTNDLCVVLNMRAVCQTGSVWSADDARHDTGTVADGIRQAVHEGASQGALEAGDGADETLPSRWISPWARARRRGSNQHRGNEAARG